MPALDIACAVLGVVFGVSAFIASQSVAKDIMDPIVKACSDPEEFAKSSYHEYEGRLGGTFVCIITNFLLELTKSPEGVLIWGLIAGLGFPSGLLLNVEAYRAGAKGVVRYPTILGVLSQVLGISVIFPLIWLPGYAWGGSRDGQLGAGKVALSLLLSIPFAILSALLFTLDTNSREWTICAGCLGGPAIALLPLFLWPTASPKDTSNAAKANGARVLARAYDIAGLLALAGYLINMQQITQAYGFDLALVWSKLWADANGAVAFMTVDTAVLYLAILLFLAIRNAADVLPAVLLLPLLGPGGAVAVALGRQERRAAAEHKKLE